MLPYSAHRNKSTVVHAGNGGCNINRGAAEGLLPKHFAISIQAENPGVPCGGIYHLLVHTDKAALYQPLARNGKAAVGQRNDRVRKAGFTTTVSFLPDRSAARVETRHAGVLFS